MKTIKCSYHPHSLLALSSSISFADYSDRTEFWRHGKTKIEPNPTDTHTHTQSISQPYIRRCQQWRLPPWRPGLSMLRTLVGTYVCIYVSMCQQNYRRQRFMAIWACFWQTHTRLHLSWSPNTASRFRRCWLSKGSASFISKMRVGSLVGWTSVPVLVGGMHVFGVNCLSCGAYNGFCTLTDSKTMKKIFYCSVFLLPSKFDWNFSDAILN